MLYTLNLPTLPFDKGELIFKPEHTYSREEFVQWAAAMDPYRLEILPDQSILLMPPVSTLSAGANAQLNFYLIGWTREDKRGQAFDSSAGFDLPDGSNRSPDAAWVLKARIDALTASQRRPFYQLCPDFVVELRSSSDRLRVLMSKMEMWMSNGARLAWLIDPEEEKAYCYRPGKPAEEVSSFEGNLDGEEVLPGFTLPLAELRLSA